MAEQVWGKLRLLGVKTICIFLMKYFVKGDYEFQEKSLSEQ